MGDNEISKIAIHSSILTMRSNKQWLLFLTFFCHLTPDCHLQQLENPRDHDQHSHQHQPQGLSQQNSAQGGQKGPRSEESEVPQQRRRYPDRSRSYSNSDPGAVFRNQNQNRNQQTSLFSQQQRSSNQQQISFNQQQNSIKQTQSFAYEPFPTNNNSRSNYQGNVASSNYQSNVIVTSRTTTTKTTLKTTQQTTVRPGQSP